MESDTFAKGLEGVIAAESTICKIDGAKGKLYYRGYSIEDLAKNCSYEEVTYLLLYGQLPTRAQLAIIAMNISPITQFLRIFVTVIFVLIEKFR